MMVADRRDEVIRNIQQAVLDGDFNRKVEVNDPKMTAAEKIDIVRKHLAARKTLGFRIKTRMARGIANTLSMRLNRDTEIRGMEHLDGITGAAMLTCNHFNPLDNTVVRFFARKAGKRRLPVVSQETNLAMEGPLGFLMNYADITPISSNPHYMQRDFLDILSGLAEKKEFILIYPEQEMWFNYRKPRPFKRGTYYYAARLNIPVIPCFVEMQDTDDMAAPGFRQVRCVLHILPPIYPDPALSVKENSVWMCRRDYELKKQAYETAYGKVLDYTFEPWDIAGWIPDGGENA